MRNLRSSSTSNPLDNRVLAVAIEFILKADAIGLLSESPDTQNLDINAIIAAVAAVSEYGIGRRVVINPERWRDYQTEDLCKRLKQLNDILEESPHSSTEWPRLRQLLSDELIASITGVSEQSVRRYAAEERTTPPEVADRLHWLALIVGDLQGAYSDDGVRNWFKRPRKSFGDKAPLVILEGKAWSASDDEPQKIRNFARGLTEGMGA